MKNSEKIKNYCKSLGLELVGFTQCRRFDEISDFLYERQKKKLENQFEAHNIEDRINPFNLYSGGKTIISIAFPYLFNVKRSTPVYFSKYTLGMDYHKVLPIYMNRILEYIHKLGGDGKCFFDSNALPERYIAKLCSLGYIGKNGLLITREYGSYVFLGEIITDLEIECEDNVLEDLCGECSLCIKACPSGCLKKVKNTNVCLSYITQCKEIDDKYFELFKGRLFGCDTCQDVCPKNKNVKYSNLPEFKPFEFAQNPDVKKILNLSNAEFKSEFKNLACAFRGKSVLSRNAMINMFYLRFLDGKSDVRFNSPYLNGYYNRLLNYYKL